jgi:hypothetical protein
MLWPVMYRVPVDMGAQRVQARGGGESGRPQELDAY